MAKTEQTTLVVNIQAKIDEAKQGLVSFQNSLNKLKLPNNLTTKLSENFKNLDKELTSYYNKLNQPIKTKADISSLDKSAKSIDRLYTSLNNTYLKVRSIPEAFEGISSKELEELRKRLEEIRTAMGNLGENNPAVKNLVTQFGAASNATDGLKTRVEAFKNAMSTGDVGQIEKARDAIGAYAKRYADLTQAATDYNGATQGLSDKQKAWVDAFLQASNITDNYKVSIGDLKQKQDETNKAIGEEGSKALLSYKTGLEQAANANGTFNKSIQQQTEEWIKQKTAMVSAEQQVGQLISRFAYFTSVTGILQVFRRVLRAAYEDVKELDAAMNSIAVVTNYTTGELWKSVDAYNELASSMGSSISGAYEVAKLYYQQGRDTNAVTDLTTETLKLARIAGLDYADATDAMTVALNAFKIETADAGTIVDVYSNLASHAAVSQSELANAMSKVASMASSVGMSLESTSAFLTQIIETTREAPETAGTALKTVLARFGEVKTLISQGETSGTTDEGEEIDVNKIDTALKSVGIRLTDTQGQMRNLDNVLIELANQWDHLDTMTQRYIATEAAGSRQQSRFIALMSDSERLAELLGTAYNSAGAGTKQFEKTQESLASKLNKLSNAWTQFTTSIANSDLIKGAIDLLTKLINTVNKLTDAFGPLSGSIKTVAIAFGLFKTGTTVLPKSLKTFSPLLGKLIAQGNQQNLGMGQSEASSSGAADATWYIRAWNSVVDKARIINNEKTQTTSTANATIQGNADAIAYLKARLSKQDTIFQLQQTTDLTESEARALFAGSADGKAYAEAKQRMIAAIEELKKSENLTTDAAYNKLLGRTGGSSYAISEIEARELIENVENGARIPKARVQGKLEGSAFAQGFLEIWAAFGPQIIAILVGAAIIGLAYISSTEFKLKQAEKQVDKVQEGIDKLNETLQTTQDEIDQLTLKAETEELTAAEKLRLKYLKNQSDELKDQIEIQKKAKYEEAKPILDEKLGNFEVKIGQKEMVYDQAGNWEQFVETTYDFDNYQEAWNKLEQAQEKAVGAEYNNLEAQQEALKATLQTNLAMTDEYATYLEGDNLTKYLEGYAALGDGLVGLSNAAPEVYNKLVELSSAGELNSQQILELCKKYPVLQTYLDATSTSAKNLAAAFRETAKAEALNNDQPNWKNAASELQSVKKSVNAVTDAFSSLYKDGYVDLDKLETLMNDDAFSGLDSFEEFINTLAGAGANDIAAVEQAMSNLVNEYFNQSSILTNLNDANRALYENELKNMGVTNASAIIEEKLVSIRAREYVNTLQLDEITQNLSDDTEQNKKYLADLAKQCNSTAEAVHYYALQKQIAQVTEFNTEEERKQLGLLIGALGEGAEAYQAYANIMSIVATQQAKLSSIQSMSTERGNAYAQKYGYEDKEDYIAKTTANVNANLVSAQAALDKANKEYTEKYLNKTTPKIDTSQFDNTSSSSTELQKLSQLYNIKKKIAEADEKIADLEEKRNYLFDPAEIAKNEQAILDAYKERASLLQTEADQIEALRKDKLAAASTDWNDFYDIVNGEVVLSDKYLRILNGNTKLQANYSTDVLNNFKKWVEEYDDIVEQAEEVNDELEKTKSKYAEIWNDWRDSYIDIVNELADIYEEEAQAEIEALEEKYDKMKDADDDYLDSLRKNIEARRDARDRENDVEDIAKKQQRLQMLMRDTSGRNAGEIASLQKEIADAQQDLIDSDVDRMLDAMEEANDKEQENWDNEIEKLEEQLEQSKKNGEFIKKAEALMEDGLPAVQKKFEDYYESQGSFSKTEIAKKLEEIETKFYNANEYLTNRNFDTWMTKILAALNSNTTYDENIDYMGKMLEQFASNGGKVDDTIRELNAARNAKIQKEGLSYEQYTTDEALLKYLQSRSGSTSTTPTTTTNNYVATTTYVTSDGVAHKGYIDEKGHTYSDTACTAAVPVGSYVITNNGKDLWQKTNGDSKHITDASQISADILKVLRANGFTAFKTGGLVDFTGPAWVDGTTTRPEAFLNAEDTKNFTELKSILSSLMRADRIASFNTDAAAAGNCTIYVNVDEIASDYDVTDAINRIKEEMISGSQYRNINLVNRRR